MILLGHRYVGSELEAEDRMRRKKSCETDASFTIKEARYPIQIHDSETVRAILYVDS